MLKVYPAIFHEEAGQFWVEFPDLQGCNTCGETLEETMGFAQEALGLYLVSIAEDGKGLPKPSPIKAIAHEETDIISFVSTDMDKYRKDNKAVRKTISLPAWLNEEAEKRNISLSKVLQESLKEQISL